MGLSDLLRDAVGWFTSRPRLRVTGSWFHFEWPPPPAEEVEFRVPLAAVIVTNEGGAACQIISAGFETEAGELVGGLEDPSYPPDTSLPYTLLPHHRVDWSVIDTAPLLHDLRRRGYGSAVRLWAYATLASGHRVLSKTAIEVAVPDDPVPSRGRPPPTT